MVASRIECQEAGRSAGSCAVAAATTSGQFIAPVSGMASMIPPRASYQRAPGLD